MNSGKELGLKLCLDCQWVCQCHDNHCPRCGARVHRRIKSSIARSWALTITAALLYIPANLLPMMTVSRFGEGNPDTIMSGVISLVNHGMLPIALLVFTASILVPLLKLLGLFWLLLSVRFPKLALKRQMKLYRLIVWVGRWSMLDIFIMAILVALVKFDQISSVTAEPGVYAFSAVVVMTMMAAISFDPRLLWDTSSSLKNTPSLMNSSTGDTA